LKLCSFAGGKNASEPEPRQAFFASLNARLYSVESGAARRILGCQDENILTQNRQAAKSQSDGRKLTSYESQLQNSVAASRQSAANLLFPSKDCGALPRRRYAGRILQLAHEVADCQGEKWFSCCGGR
jgi:hypothetical protein